VGKGQHKKLRLFCNGRDRVYNLQRKLADLCKGVKDGTKVIRALKKTLNLE